MGALQARGGPEDLSRITVISLRQLIRAAPKVLSGRSRIWVRFVSMRGRPTISMCHLRFARVLPALLVVASSMTAPYQSLAKRPVTIDDVLNMQRIDRATLSPDGEWVAAVVRRAAREGEVYGRASYDADPTRSDVWLISTRTGDFRNLTQGASKAAGFWCATWSPDAKRLAMLSTLPEGTEARGGDNVRLYVWDRTSGSLSRMSEDGVMTQTRYGSPLNVLDMRGGDESAARACSSGLVAENAPFLWLDDNRLLVATLPHGEVAAAVDQYDRPYRDRARDIDRVHGGRVPTVSVVASGRAMRSSHSGIYQSFLKIVDVRSRQSFTIANVPAYPFRGGLTASVSPDGKRLAVLATIGALPPEKGRRLPNSSIDAWTVERRLGFVDLSPSPLLHWTNVPDAARYPLELYGWSPNGRNVVFRARTDRFADATSLFLADAARNVATPLDWRLQDQSQKTFTYPHPIETTWVDRRRLVVKLADGKWWITDTSGPALEIAIPKGTPQPDQLFRAGDGTLIALAGSTLFRLDAKNAALVPLVVLSGEASFLTQEASQVPLMRRLASIRQSNGADCVCVINTVTGAVESKLSVSAEDVIEANLTLGLAILGDETANGSSLRRINILDGTSQELLSLNGFVKGIEWGENNTISYNTANGTPLNGSIILPPGYQKGKRYPTIVWVYPGHNVPVNPLDEYMTSKQMPGIYNLHLYAAKGYVVLVPSMPIGSRGKRQDIYNQISLGVLPAVDKLVEMGITDPDRVGLLGQSFGGYGVYSLITQSNRFHAAVAIAGLSDLASNYGQFDPTARGYPGIEHEKSDNWAEMSIFGLQNPPWHDLSAYTRNSPLSYVDRVTTPLLMIHGDMDIRGAPAQAEMFFYSLYAQGKTAEFLRYGGESHSLAQSPANIRDVFDRTIAWFDRYLDFRTKGSHSLTVTNTNKPR